MYHLSNPIKYGWLERAPWHAVKYAIIEAMDKYEKIAQELGVLA